MASEQQQAWGVVVPVKRLDSAKTRMSTLPADQRRSLALAFALDVVAVSTGNPMVRAVVVIAADREVRDAAASLGAAAVPDPAGEGLVPALLHGVSVLRTSYPELAVALVMADLPCLRTEDLTMALQAANGYERAYVSDLAGTGSTMLTALAGVAPDPRFGPRSRAAHAATGAHELREPSLVRLRCDVDTTVDLWYARALGVGPRTASVLQQRRG